MTQWQEAKLDEPKYWDKHGTHKGVNAQEATTRACARARARFASNYPFAKLMEIAESVPTGRVRATSDKILNFYHFTRAL